MAPRDTTTFVDTAQMIEVDRAMVEDFHICLIQMMENAGRHLAQLARRRFFAGDPIGKRVVVMAGTGGNGGGALVGARHLHNWGAEVRVVLSRPAEAMTTIPAHQLDILQRMHIPGADCAAPEAEMNGAFELVIDGLIGYSLKGAPREPVASLIRWANRQAAPILSLDTPSGVDLTTGNVHMPAIRAAATLTLALPKTRMREPGVKRQLGELYVADISVPPELYASPFLGLEVGPLFAHEEIIRLW